MFPEYMGSIVVTEGFTMIIFDIIILALIFVMYVMPFLIGWVFSKKNNCYFKRTTWYLDFHLDVTRYPNGENKE